MGAYVALTKPRIIELLLVTTFPVMFLAERGIPPIWLIVATLVGGTLAAASANVLNCYLDRDIDAQMHRTSQRPLVTGTITPRAALAFGEVVPQDGDVYGVPYAWGPYGIVYNTAEFPTPPTSWSIFWDEKYKHRFGINGTSPGGENVVVGPWRAVCRHRRPRAGRPGRRGGASGPRGVARCRGADVLAESRTAAELRQPGVGTAHRAGAG